VEHLAAAEAVRRTADRQVVPEAGTAVAGLVAAGRQGRTEELPVKKSHVSILFNPDSREYCSACEDEHSRRGLAEEIQGSSCMVQGCMAQDCRAQDCKEPAVRTKAARQVEVASSRPAAVVVAARIEVAVAGTVVPGRTVAAAAAQAIGSHRPEGMETGYFAVGVVGGAQGRASTRLAVVARARHRHRLRQQPDVLREAFCRVERFGAVFAMGLRQSGERMVRPEGVGAR
jgi:hypothetical protein